MTSLIELLVTANRRSIHLLGGICYVPWLYLVFAQLIEQPVFIFGDRSSTSGSTCALPELLPGAGSECGGSRVFAGLSGERFGRWACHNHQDGRVDPLHDVA